MNMEFLSRNYFNTTTAVTVNTGTGSESQLIDRSSTLFTASMATTTSTTFTAHITLNKNINRIVLENINWKNFSILNSGTAFSLTNAATIASSWTNNSATTLYLYFPTTSVNTLTVIVSSNTAASLSHTIEQMWVCELIHQVERNPEAKNYKIKLDRKEYIHQLADGGTVQYILNDYFDAKIKWEYVSQTERDNMRTVFDQKDAVTFVPFPTATSWNQEIYEVVWTGDFNFVQRAYNVESAGYNGDITLRETGK